MPYGFNNCNAKFGQIYRGVSEANMHKLARESGADGFAYQSSLRYGYVLTNVYNRSCQSPEKKSWPLFLKTIEYTKVPYGFNGCSAKFGPNVYDVTRKEVASLANQAGADGYAYHSSLKSGAVLTAPYDRTCQSPPNQSWPFYLTVE